MCRGLRVCLEITWVQREKRRKALTLKTHTRPVFPISIRIDVLLSNVFREVFSYIKDDFSLGIANKYKSLSRFCLGLLIGYLILITAIAFGMWLPFLLYLNSQDERSNQLLSMIPLCFIVKIRHIYVFLEDRAQRIQGFK
eukprot:TRINITY_DN7783_c0_g4_i1.p1 TRINITY_DN7783_c0_g4~~TRINITY_DN7783_c0_g4_i1.p1  ORF type:complete len:140 (-),score=8.16 TRINITY_DN7783_c0_g4_i1:55-474(-)